MVRRFAAGDVDDTTIDTLIAAAIRAPSAGNTQPWAFVVVRDRERRAQLGHAAFGQMFVATAPVVIAACADVPRSAARYRDRAERYSTIDVAFASLCLLLKATELGLGACFVGAIDDAEVARVLALPSHVRPLAVIPVGWPAERPKAAKLRPAGEVLRRERWSAEPAR
jgi:nitroreductase